MNPRIPAGRSRAFAHPWGAVLTARSGLVGLISVLSVLCFAPTPASAAVIHKYEEGLSQKLGEGVPVTGPHGETELST